MIALIDGDVLTYRSGFAVEDRKNNEVEPFSHCIKIIDNTIESILKGSKSDDYEIYLTGKGNFREEIATILPYKGNRDPSSKPYYYETIREYLQEEYQAQVIEGQEADDAMAIRQYTDYDNLVGFKQASTVICTNDKDLDMIPGWHYNWPKDKLYWRTEDDCRRWFYTQLLTGDSIDNILGIKGVGAKTANKILDDADREGQDYLCRVAREYAKAYDDPEAALIETGRLLWMRRSEGEMWSLDYA